MEQVSVVIESKYAQGERRFYSDWSLGELAQRLELITGIQAEHQRIKITNGSETCDVSEVFKDKSKTVANLNIQPHSIVHVEGIGDKSFDDTVEKYEMPLQEYESRSNSVLAWKKIKKLGRFADENEKPQPCDNSIKVGDRFITSGNRRGTVKYIGPVKEISIEGIWVGVEFDQPVGKNDGSINGKRYFTTGPNYGGFLKAVSVDVGDYPPVTTVEEL